MDEKTVIDVLKKWNVWEKKIDAGIKRKKYIDKIYSFIERKEIIALKGIRRSGKSTIINQLIKELIKNKVDKKQILYLNLEDYNFVNELNLELFEKALKAYLKYSKNKKKTYFFIDEIQQVKNWEKWIRTKYDLNEKIKFIITGSSASLLSKELSTLLTGRNISFIIRPLSFEEFQDFSKNKSLEEYLKFGGFPEVALEENQEKKNVILQQYFEDIIHKDIIDRYDIRNSKQLIQIARYLVSVSGSKVSINKLSKVFGISKDTISNYINYLIDAYLLQEVSFFSFSAKVKHDVTKLPKLYALDNGLVNAVNIKYSKNQGQMFENTVFLKLAEEYDEINYWDCLGSEVDFIAGNKAINVTSSDKIHERENKGLEDFHKKHKKFVKLLITPTVKKEKMIPILDFLKS